MTKAKSPHSPEFQIGQLNFCALPGRSDQNRLFKRRRFDGFIQVHPEIENIDDDLRERRENPDPARRAENQDRFIPLKHDQGPHGADRPPVGKGRIGCDRFKCVRQLRIAENITGFKRKSILVDLTERAAQFKALRSFAFGEQELTTQREQRARIKAAIFVRLNLFIVLFFF